jgi:peptidyl-prolyl cis-trans isomerase C
MWLWSNYKTVVGLSKSMKNISKSLILLCAAAPLMVFGATPDKPVASTNATTKASTNLGALFGDTVVAKGKGVEVKRNELDAEVVNTRAVLAARGIPTPPDLDQQALKSLIIKQLILNKATDADRAKGKANFENQLAKLQKDSGLSDEEFNKRISTQLFGGQTREQWNKQNIEQATIPVVLQRELNINITDEDVKKFYNDPTNTAAFEQPEMVRASHILLMTQDPDTKEPLSDAKKAEKKKQMEDILKQAKDGKDFAELAKKYSEDPGSKDKGGEYTFPRGQMVPQFENTAFSLKPGEISEIIETQFGYHIIKLSEKMPAKKVDFDKVKDEIHDVMVRQAIQKQFLTFAQKLQKDANVEILDEKLKGADLLLQPPKEQDAAPAGK